MTDYYDAIGKASTRYRAMVSKFIDDNDYWGWQGKNRQKFIDLLRFIIEIDFQCNQKKLSLNKLNHWIGYVQGFLIAHGITSVKTERDATRPWFRPLDFEDDYEG